jgi:hypothetical protein
MSKLREDSTWNQISAEQRQTLESWLFDENLSYPKTLAKVQAEFGLMATAASLGRYYRRRARERQAEEMRQAGDAAALLDELPVDARDLRTAAVKLVGKTLLTVAAERPGEWEALASLTKLLLDSEQNEIRRARLQFVERCFDQQVTAAVFQEAPRLRARLIEIADDPSLDRAGQLKRINELLYGWKKPADGPPPAEERKPL